MAVDEELVVYNLLNTYWNGGTVTKPPLYYTNDMKEVDGKLGLKIYAVDSTTDDMLSETEARVSIDFWSQSRADVMLMRDEIYRILKTYSAATGSAYDYMQISSGKKMASYTRFYRYVIDVMLQGGFPNVR